VQIRGRGRWPCWRQSKWRIGEHGVDRCIRKGLVASGFHVRGWRSSWSAYDGVVGDRAVRLVRCKRAGIRRLRTGRCDPWRAMTADSEEVCAQQGWTRYCCGSSRRARRGPLSTFGSDERRSVEGQTRHAQTPASASSLCLLPVPPCCCTATNTPSYFLPSLLRSTTSIHHVQTRQTRLGI
jgi:hypothetical protein